MTKLLNSNLHTINFLHFNKFSLDVTFSMYPKNMYPNEIKICQLSGFFLNEGKSQELKLSLTTNLLNTQSDQHLISLPINTAESYIKVLKIKKIISNLRTLIIKPILLVSNKSMENMGIDVRVKLVKMKAQHPDVFLGLIRFLSIINIDII